MARVASPRSRSPFSSCALRRLEPPPVSASYILPCSPTTTTTILFAANHLCVTFTLLLGLKPASAVTISLNKMPRIAKDTILIKLGLFVRGTSSLVCSTCSWFSQVSCARITLYQLRGVFRFIFPKYRIQTTTATHRGELATCTALLATLDFLSASHLPAGFEADHSISCVYFSLLIIEAVLIVYIEHTRIEAHWFHRFSAY